ncbi:MAG: hypothetical protein AABY22_22920 [Nanoarchaeota archaeon]
MVKKKVFIHTDFSLSKTGFGRNAKALLTYLYKTNKYDLVHYACGINFSNPHLTKTPWRTIGCLPDNPKELELINRDPQQQKIAGYGGLNLDKAIYEEKPDIYIAIQDYWGVDYAIDKKWFNKIPCVLWITLDSLPILPPAIEKAPKIKNYWVWSNFAEKELHRLGHTHVKTVHGIVDDSSFFRLPDSKRKELRKKFGILEDAFIGIDVFRNQLRKSVPNILQGYKLFKQNNFNLKQTYLIFHTAFTEGWDLPRFIKEFKIPENELLTTYICHTCNEYEIKSYKGEQQNCRFCGTQKSQQTTNVGRGVTEEQLNEIYNLADYGIFSFTSGGLEIPIVESKLTELITLVTNYSCGEEHCEEGAGSLPLDWAEYREPGTQFIKSSTYPNSIAKQLTKLYNMDKDKRRKQEIESRKWAIKNFSPENVCKPIEEFLDNCEITNYNFDVKEPLKNPNAQVNRNLPEPNWILALYKDILCMDIDKTDSGFIYWMGELEKGANKDQVEGYFRQVALKHNSEQQGQKKFEDLLDKNDEGKRMIFVIPESIGDVYLCTSLFKSIKETYPDWNLYVATKPEYFSILDGNSHVFRVLQYIPEMDNIFWLEGMGNHKGYFNIAFLPYVGTQRHIDYVHNGIDRIQLDINEKEESCIY